MKVAVAGVTGLVGEMMLKILEERNFPVDKLLPVASDKSIGSELVFRNKRLKVISMSDALSAKPQIALFSAGSNPSLEWAPKFSKVGTTVIDNSSAWRMHKEVRLIVPEINGRLLSAKDKIIANPNCSTIQMVMALAPLHAEYKLKRIVVSTYQSVTGTGRKAIEQLENERQGISGPMAYPYKIDMNCIPQVDVFMENAYTKEEMKMVNETRKILNDQTLRITATTVRIPVVGGHSESVNAEFENDFDMDEVLEILTKTKGVKVMDDISKLVYPMPLSSHNKDAVFVGRLRRDEGNANTLNMWIVADNLRKGAATNAVQIAEQVRKFF